MMALDFASRYCWLASSVGGAWRWQTPTQREDTCVSLSLCYAVVEKNQPNLTNYEQQVLEALLVLGDVIYNTFDVTTKRRVNMRISDSLGIITQKQTQPF